MKTNKRLWLSLLVILALIVAMIGCKKKVDEEEIQAFGWTHLTGLHVAAPTTYATATPGAVIDCAGLGNCFEIRDAATPVVQFYNGGGSLVQGDLEINGTTPLLTIGDAGAEDTTILFDGNAQDFYVALDDTADDLLIGLGAAVGTTGIIHLDASQDTGLGGASAGAKLDVTGNVLVDGAADEVQLTAQGYTTQTNHIFVAEVAAGTDLFWITNDGDVEMNGTTPLLTIGDAGTEDTMVLFDGQAQDYHLALDDTADDLILGLGSAAGTTPIISMDENRTVTIDADLIVDDTFNIDDTAYTSVGAQTLSPSASFYTLAPTAVLTLTLGTTGVGTGDFVWFISTVSTSTVIVDTTATAGGGNRTLGQNDAIGFIYTGSVWAEAFYSDNS